MATVRFLVVLSQINLRSALSMRAATLLQAAFMFFNNLIYLSVWVIFFRRFHDLGGFGLQDMLLTYGIVAAGFGAAVALAGGLRELSKMVVDGALDCYLSQPKPVLAQALCSRTIASGWGDLASGLIMAGFSQRVSLAHVPYLLLAIVVSASVFVAAGVIFHSAAFWLGPVDSLARTLWEFLITFSVYPETIFHGGIRLFLFTLMPAAFAGFLPARLVREPSLANVAVTVGGALLLVSSSLLIFARGLRRYESGNQIAAR
ncbi:MAG TPA: ABC-2 family transporter protein [Polyangiaceae bacterium]|nr:ABC-2 family transporter protein [Polyangiaceae bacterium]